MARGIRKDVEVYRLTPEELVEIRRDRLMAIMGRAASSGYFEILLDGSADEGYDPAAVAGVFPVEHEDGKFTTDLVYFSREGAGSEDDYLRRVEDLTLDGTGFATYSGIRPDPQIDLAAQVVGMMSALAGSLTPSGVLVFSGIDPRTAAAHLFYPIYLPPSEALSQLKGMAQQALSENSAH